MRITAFCLAITWACQTNAMDMTLIANRHNAKTNPVCVSEAGRLNVRRIHSMNDSPELGSPAGRSESVESNRPDTVKRAIEVPRRRHGFSTLITRYHWTLCCFCDSRVSFSISVCKPQHTLDRSIPPSELAGKDGVQCGLPCIGRRKWKGQARDCSL